MTKQNRTATYKCQTDFMQIKALIWNSDQSKTLKLIHNDPLVPKKNTSIVQIFLTLGPPI